MSNGYLEIKQSGKLSGEVSLVGAKNAVLVTMASLLLTSGKSKLTNVPASVDVLHMIKLLKELGAHVLFDKDNHILEVDTSFVNSWCVPHEIMKQMRASILVMGPLLARFARADVALPGGCVIGKRPIDLHLNNFAKMGVEFIIQGDFLQAYTSKLIPSRLVLEYPSVGATENILMAAVLASGSTKIINAALEPEVLDLIDVLRKMGAKIELEAPATIIVQGVQALKPIEHQVMVDRLEAGALLCAAAITGGSITITNAQSENMDVFLLKLEQMGHRIVCGESKGISLYATQEPKAVSFKTAPYPGFPTDLQAPLMALQTVAQGQSVIEEAVFENRLLHARELAKMGAQITVEGNKAIVTGVDHLYGASVIATDIRASCSLVLAGLIATGPTIMTGIHHWQRGYEALENKLVLLGADIALKYADEKQSLYQDSVLSYEEKLV